MLFYPPRFALGFLVLSNIAHFVYKCTDIYNKKAKSGILYNYKYKSLNIIWQNYNNFILSEKDGLL